jgi:hypothetical protein
MSCNFSLSEIIFKGVVLVTEWPAEVFSAGTPLVGNDALIRGATLDVPLFADYTAAREVLSGEGSGTNEVDSFAGTMECTGSSVLRLSSVEVLFLTEISLFVV